MHFPPTRAGQLVTMLLIGLVSACSVEILHDVDESTANEVLAALNRTGIEGSKLRAIQGSQAAYTVAVSRAEAAAAWRVLRQEHLPHPAQQGLGEVFGKTGLVPTATQERALMHHAMAGELSRTLQGIEGVLDARVHLVLTTRDPLAPADAPTSPSKASVLLRTRPGVAIERRQVQELVAGSVKDLKPEMVSVVVVAQPAPRDSTTTAPLRSVGPFQVAAGSRTALVVTLVVALVVVALLGGANIVLLRRNRLLGAELQRAMETTDHGLPRGTASRLEGSLGLIERSLTAASRIHGRSSSRADRGSLPGD